MLENERFKEIFDKSPIGILIYGSDGKLEDANRAALEIMGCKLDTIVGMDIFHNKEVRQKLANLDETGPIKFQGRLTEHFKDANHLCQNSSLFIQFYVSKIDSGYLVEIQDITEKKEEQEKIMANEKKYQSFFEDDLTGDFIAKPDGTILDCNPSFIEIYGLENLEIALKTNISRFNPDDWLNLVEQLKQDQKIKGHQTVHTRLDGSVIHVVANIVGIFNDSNELLEIKGYLFDDTERKKAEQFLKESKEKYHKLFDEDLTGDFIATLDGKILECNPAFADIYGFYDRDKAAKSNISKFNSFDWPYMITRLKRERKLLGFQSWQRRSDGMRIHVVANLVGIFNEENEMIQVKGYMFDDTERKKAEEEVKRSKSQMNEILDSIQDGFVALSQYWHFTYVNHCAEEFFNADYDDLIGQNLWETFPELIGSEIEKGFKKAKDDHEIQHFESPGLKNSEKWYDFSVYPSSDGISAYWRDVTERREKTEK